MEFDLEAKLKKGISFGDIFRSLMFYSMSLFVGFYWSDLLKETLLAWMPHGEGIIMKASVGLLATIMIVFVAYILMHGNNTHKKLEVRKSELDS